MIKAILLDIDDTLLSFSGYVKESMRTGFQKYGLPPYREEMFSTFQRINTGLWQALERGELTFEELIDVRWNRVFRELGVEFDGHVFEKFFREALFDSAIPVEGAMELLQALHGKYPLYAASNGPYHQQVHRLEISGMLSYFSQLFISEEIGASKPSPAFFDACMARLNSDGAAIRPEEVLIIGDSLTSDMAGGLACGMQTCFYDPRRRGIPAEMALTWVVHDLSEIPRLLAA